MLDTLPQTGEEMCSPYLLAALYGVCVSMCMYNRDNTQRKKNLKSCNKGHDAHKLKNNSYLLSPLYPMLLSRVR